MRTRYATAGPIATKESAGCVTLALIVITARVLVVGLGAGLLFAVLDGLLNANPVAQRLYAFYKPVARESARAFLGLGFDLLAGVAMAALFVLLAPALPGNALAKGLVFGLIAWFFRTVMSVAAQMVMFRVTGAAAAYTLVTGLFEMCVLGAIIAIALPRAG